MPCSRPCGPCPIGVKVPNERRVDVSCRRSPRTPEPRPRCSHLPPTGPWPCWTSILFKSTLADSTCPPLQCPSPSKPVAVENRPGCVHDSPHKHVPSNGTVHAANVGFAPSWSAPRAACTVFSARFSHRESYKPTGRSTARQGRTTGGAYVSERSRSRAPVALAWLASQQATEIGKMPSDTGQQPGKY